MTMNATNNDNIKYFCQIESEVKLDLENLRNFLKNSMQSKDCFYVNFEFLFVTKIFFITVSNQNKTFCKQTCKIFPASLYHFTQTHYSDWANWHLLLLLNAASLTEKQLIPILMSLVGLSWGLNPKPPALEASLLTIKVVSLQVYTLDLCSCKVLLKSIYFRYMLKIQISQWNTTLVNDHYN